MATIVLTIPDAVVGRVLAAFKSAYNYDAATDGPQGAFVKSKLVGFIREVVAAEEANAAAEAARQAAVIAAQTEVTPT